MKGAKLDLLIIKGSTFQKSFILKDTAGVPINLLGAGIESKMRKAFDSPVEVNLHAVITDPANGRCQIKLTHLETEQINFSTGVYDVEITFATGDVEKVLFGNVVIKPEVTYG